MCTGAAALLAGILIPGQRSSADPTSQESTQSLQDLDSSPGIVGRMMLHVMSTGHGRAAASPIGLCGAKVAGLYFSKVPGAGKRESHLCPACKALAAANAGGTHPAPPARARSPPCVGNEP